MAGYSRALKCTIASQYIDEGVSSIVLARTYGITATRIRYWGRVYAIHGARSFERPAHPPRGDFKRQALTLMWTNGWSVRHTSAFLNLSSPGLLSAWLRQYREEGADQPLDRTRGRPPVKKPAQDPLSKSDDEMTLQEMKRALAYLRAENAVLKKYQELEQQKQKQTRKKR